MCLIASCKKKEIHNQHTQGNDKDTIDLAGKEFSIKSKETLTPKQLLALYAESQSSDTVIPYEVYKIAKANIFLKGGWSYSAYESYDEEKQEYESKLRQLFLFDKGLDSLFPKIEKHIQWTRELNRELVLSDYNEYNSLEGPSFAYLCKVKDPFALEMTKKIFNNQKAHQAELKRIASWILDNFNDSTYVKITEAW